MMRCALVVTVWCTLCVAIAARSGAQVSVLTEHYDNARTGLNSQEAILTPRTVNQQSFGRIFWHRVDGDLYAQPLVLPNVTIPGAGVHNVVYVATEHDTVYAWDADTSLGNNGAPLWEVSFIDPSAGVTTIPSVDTLSLDLVPEVGITSTPVIDDATGTLYVVVRTKEGSAYAQRLHALDVATGEEKMGGPVTIEAFVPGTGDSSVDGVVGFDALRENQRAGLLLLDGVVYIAWAAHGDHRPYHGWVIGYDARTLKQVGVFNATPDGGLGGIWQSGVGPAADAEGNVYVATGNGDFDANLGGLDFGDSVVCLDPRRGLTVADYFTPFNEQSLDNDDLDLGAGGVVVLPDQPGSHPHLLVASGKDGEIYVLDRDNMGHFRSEDDSQIVEAIPSALGRGFGAPAFWNGTLYYAGVGNVMQAFALSDGVLSRTPLSQAGSVFGFPGATPVLSANGETDGIVWVLENDRYDDGPTVLHAYDATDLSHELYNSRLAGGSGYPGTAVKFTVPVVANGKVYVGAKRRLTVFAPLDRSSCGTAGAPCAVAPPQSPVRISEPAVGSVGDPSVGGCSMSRRRKGGIASHWLWLIPVVARWGLRRVLMSRPR